MRRHSSFCKHTQELVASTSHESIRAALRYFKVKRYSTGKMSILNGQRPCQVGSTITLFPDHRTTASSLKDSIISSWQNNLTVFCWIFIWAIGSDCQMNLRSLVPNYLFNLCTLSIRRSRHCRANTLNPISA